MILDSKIKSMVEKINSLTGLQIVRAEQFFEKPKYPYATYKIIQSNEESATSNIYTRETIVLEQINVEQTHQFNEEIFSLNVIGNVYSDTREATQRLFEIMKDSKFLNHCRDLELTIILGKTNITDRSIILESDYEYRFGFDIAIHNNRIIEKRIETIESIGMESNATLGNEQIKNEIINIGDI